MDWHWLTWKLIRGAIYAGLVMYGADHQQERPEFSLLVLGGLVLLACWVIGFVFRAFLYLLAAIGIIHPERWADTPVAAPAYTYHPGIHSGGGPRYPERNSGL